jgi:gliding motility-associated-like protein
VAECSLVIYNRWGEVVFETTDQAQCWDGSFKGKTLNADVFAYKLQVKLQDGTFVDQAGSIQLIR